MMKSRCDIEQTLRDDPEQGFEQLVRDSYTRIYAHVRRLVVTHADAQDVTQETFIRAYRALPSFRGDSSALTWLLRIATNESLRWLGRKTEYALSENADPDIADDEYIDLSDIEAVALQKAIHRLPPKQQAIFNLRYFDEAAYDDIARITDSTPSAVKASYSIAKNKVIEYLKQYI